MSALVTPTIQVIPGVIGSGYPVALIWPKSDTTAAVDITYTLERRLNSSTPWSTYTGYTGYTSIGDLTTGPWANHKQILLHPSDAASNYDYRVTVTWGSETSTSTACTVGSYSLPVPVITGHQILNFNSDAGTCSCKITWSGVTGATRYYIYRAPSSASGAVAEMIGSTASSVLTYTDTGLTAGAYYYYWVKANTGYSSTVAVVSNAVYQVLALTQLAAPVISLDEYTGTGTNYAYTLNWNAVSNASSYYVYRSVDGGVTWTRLTTVGSARTYYNITTANAANDAVFMVVAVGDHTNYSDSPRSNIVDQSTSTPLDAPVITATLQGGADPYVRVTWPSVANATSYTVERRATNNSSDSSWHVIGTATGTGSTITYNDTDATVAYNYQYRVMANSSSIDYSSSDYSNVETVFVEATLSSPVITATLSGSTGPNVVVSWAKVDDAESYLVQRKLSSSSTWSDLTTSTASTATISITDTNTARGNTYNYRVYARSSLVVYNDSAASNIATVTVPLLPLSAPTVTSSTSADGNTATLSWSAVTNATSYQILRRPASGGSYTVVTTTTGTSYDISKTGLSGDYDYVVVAVGDGVTYGNSAQSNAVRVTAKTKLSTPIISATVQNDTSVLVSWPKIANATSYTIQRKLSSSSSWSNLTTSTSTSATIAITDSTVSQGSSYDYRVQATAGTTYTQSDWSNTATVEIPYTIVQLSAPEASIGLGGSSGTSPVVTWTGVTNASGYQVQRKLSTASTWSSFPNVSSTTRSFTDTTAVAGNTYNYRVIAVGDGTNYTNSAASNVVTQLVPTSSGAETLASPTTIVRIATAGETDVTVNWTTVTNASGYLVQRKASGESTFTTVYEATRSTAHSYTDTTTTAGSTYTYRVIAVGDGVNYVDSDPSNEATITVPTAGQATPLSPPLEFEGVVIDDDTVFLHWDSDPNASGYEVYRREAGSDQWSLVYSGTDTAYIDSNCDPGTTYEYRMKVVGDGTTYSDSSYTTPISVTPGESTGGTELPTPSATGAVSTGDTPYVTLVWTPIAGAESYTIYKKTDDSSTWTPLVTTSDTSYIDYALEPGKTYNYEIVANGNGSDYADSIPSDPFTAEIPSSSTPTTGSDAASRSIGIIVDGVRYTVGVEYESMKRSMLMKEGPNTGTSITGRDIRDILGSTYSYTMTIHPIKHYQAQYDTLFLIITNEKDYHTVTLPFGQGSISFDAKIDSVSDVYRGYHSGTHIWDNMDVTFTPIGVTYTLSAIPVANISLT